MVSCSAAEDGVEDTARRAELLVDDASKRGEERGKTASHCHVLHVGMCTCIDSGRFYPRQIPLRCCVPSRALLCRAATCTLRPLRPTRIVPFGSGSHWLLLPNGCADQSLLRNFCLKLVVPWTLAETLAEPAAHSGSWRVQVERIRSCKDSQKWYHQMDTSTTYEAWLEAARKLDEYEGTSVTAPASCDVHAPADLPPVGTPSR
jgi:hypothetical protein